MGGWTLYDDFNWPDTTLDRKIWWRGGLAGVDGGSAVLNESDLTSSALFSNGDFAFTIGGSSASSQGLFGLGDIDDGDPYLVLSNNGSGWRFHVRSGPHIYTGPVLAPALAKGDKVVFHWDSAGASVALNGVVRDAQTVAHPPCMPLTMLEWNNSGTDGQIVMDAVRVSASAVTGAPPSAQPLISSASSRVFSAELVEDMYVDSSNPDACLNGGAHAVYVRNCRYHPDLTGAGETVDAGHLGLLQFVLPPLPLGWKVVRARLAGVVAQNHKLYGMAGWAPGRPIELEMLGLSVNPDLATATYHTLHDAAGHGIIAGYSASGSVNFTYGSQARSLEVLRFSSSAVPVGSLLQFPDREGRLCAFVGSVIRESGPAVITLALGPGRTQAVSGMECDFKLYARENGSGHAPVSLTLSVEKAEYPSRPRLCVLTDIGGDPDDQQSLVRLMVYANEFQIEGLIASASGTRGELKRAVTRPDLIREIVAAYGRVRPNLLCHAAGWPTCEALAACVKSGNPQRGREHIGEGHDTEGSRWLVNCVDAGSPERPLNLAIWGGQTDLAQALWRVKRDRGPAGLAQFARRLRVYDINDQDGIAEWMRGEFPGLHYILAKAPQERDKREGIYRGVYLGGDESLTSRAWVEANVSGKGPLGALYPLKTWTEPNPHGCMKEGDTPSWFFFLPPGGNDPADPGKPGWGGQFERRADGWWRDIPGSDPRAAVHRWRPQFQSDFARRMAWCAE